MALTRPLKEGSVPTYQQKVALGFPDILASEMDADLDTIYAAWNGGVGTAALVDGAVTDAKIAQVGWNKLTTGTIAAGGDLAGSSYPNPVIGAGTITQAKLAADVSGLVRADLSTPGSLGANSTVFATLLDMTSTVLVPNRRYRLTLEGGWSKAIACNLYLTAYIAAVNVFLGNLSGGGIASEAVWYLLDFQFLQNGAGTVYVSCNITISNAVAGGLAPAAFGRQVLKTGLFTGAGTQGPNLQIQFDGASAGNGVNRFNATLEML